MTTQTQQANPAYRTKIVSIETVGRDGKPLERPIVVFPTGVGPSKNYGGRFAYDADKVAQFKAGDEVYLEIARGDLKKGVTAPKWDTDYYWNIVRLEPYTNQQPPQRLPAAPPVSQHPELPPHPADRAPEVLRGSPPAAQVQKPPTPTTPAATPPMPMHDPDAAEKRKRDDIFRSVALQQAVQLVIPAALPPGKDLMEMAGMYAQACYEILLTLHAPEPEAK